jgi:hypothetical protein
MVERLWGTMTGRARHRHRLPWWRAVPQWAVMLVLVHIGWLMFREADVQMLFRDLTLLPGSSTPAQRQAGLYLFLVALTFSLPLWAHSGWTAWRGSYTDRAAASEAAVPTRFIWLQGLAVGVMFAAILVLRSRTSLDFIYFQF